MTTLDEALARLDRTNAPNVYRPDIEPIVAAARNWQALSNPSNELVERVAEAIYTKKWGPSMSGPKPGAMERDMAYSVIEAVRVTGENPDA